MFTVTGDVQLALLENYMVQGIQDDVFDLQLGGGHAGPGVEARHIAALSCFDLNAEASVFFSHSNNGSTWESLATKTTATGSQANSVRLSVLTNPRRKHVRIHRMRIGSTAVLGTIALLFGFRKSAVERNIAASTWANEGVDGAKVAYSPGTV